MKEFFATPYRWQGVYYHFRKWCSDGSWERMWQKLLKKHKNLLDMSNIQLDGTHTPVKRGGESVGYQGRKKCKTSNLLILADSRGTPLACSEPIAGNHHDTYKLMDEAEAMLQSIEASGIRTDGLFLNADAGFDHTDFRAYCNRKDIIHNIAENPRNGSHSHYLFDELLYKHRFVIERTNAWIDAFKALLIRFETKQLHWRMLHFLAFCVILLRRL
jgi:transposase